MSDGAQLALVTLVVAPLVGLLIAIGYKKFGLTDEAKAAVAGLAKAGSAPESGKTRLPSDQSAAFIMVSQQYGALAKRLEQVERDSREAKALAETQRNYLTVVIAWGYRGWAHAPEPHEPIPAPPKELTD